MVPEDHKQRAMLNLSIHAHESWQKNEACRTIANGFPWLPPNHFLLLHLPLFTHSHHCLMPPLPLSVPNDHQNSPNIIVVATLAANGGLLIIGCLALRIWWQHQGQALRCANDLVPMTQTQWRCGVKRPPRTLGSASNTSYPELGSTDPDSRIPSTHQSISAVQDD